MSFWDYVLPWKAIPKMAKDVKAAWGGDGKNRHDSFVGAIGKYADPGGALLGKDWLEFWHGTIPREINRALEPVGEFHRDHLDPIYKVAGDTELGKNITDHGVNKGGDWSALITAAVVGAGALAGGAGTPAGGGTGQPAPTNTMSNQPWRRDWSSMDWSNQQTYMDLYRDFSQMPQPPSQDDEERRQRAMGLLPPRWQ